MTMLNASPDRNLDLPDALVNTQRQGDTPAPIPVGGFARYLAAVDALLAEDGYYFLGLLVPGPILQAATSPATMTALGLGAVHELQATTELWSGAAHAKNAYHWTTDMVWGFATYG